VIAFRRAILETAARRGAHNVRVFDSVARGDDSDTSDIDLLVDLDDGVGLVALAGLNRELAELLRVDVDIVPARMLKPAIRDEVLAEAIAL
jgi:predicted nucleotidyltransferase